VCVSDRDKESKCVRERQRKRERVCETETEVLNVKSTLRELRMYERETGGGGVGKESECTCAKERCRM